MSFLELSHQTKRENNPDEKIEFARLIALNIHDKETVFLGSGSTFNGVLCGHATWKGVVEPFAKEGVEVAREWLRSEGTENITELNKVIERTATPWTEIVEVI